MKINIKKNNFDKNGFLVLKKIFSFNEINNILNELDKIKKKVITKKNKKYHHKTNDGKINTIHNIQEFYECKTLMKIINKKKLILTLSNLLKGPIKMRNLEFFLKPKRSGLSTPFHQDNFYWNFAEGKALNVWLACSNSSKKNGGLCYLRGSHKLGTINHKLSFAKGSSQMIPKNILNKLKFKKIFPKLKKGDCLIHDSEIIHGSEKNYSDENRVGLTISYASAKAKIDIIKLRRYKNNLKKNLNKLYD